MQRSRRLWRLELDDEERRGRSPVPWVGKEEAAVAASFAAVGRPCPVCGRGGRQMLVGSDPVRRFVVAACGDAFGDGPGCGHSEAVCDEATGTSEPG